MSYCSVCDCELSENRSCPRCILNSDLDSVEDIDLPEGVHEILYTLRELGYSEGLSMEELKLGLKAIELTKRFNGKIPSYWKR